MKPILSTITFFVFLFTYSTKSPFVRASMPEPVVDISGEELKAGMSYHVLPAFRGRGGGLSFDHIGNGTCPHHAVVQERLELSKGKPVLFFPLNPKSNIIFTSSDLNIKFSDTISTRVESGVWEVTKLISEAMNVATNGVAGNLDIFNWFMIDKAELEGVYRLMFCPKPPFVVCEDLGIFSYGDGGKRYLGLANTGEFQTLRVVFQKANVDNAIYDGDAVMSS